MVSEFVPSLASVVAGIIRRSMAQSVYYGSLHGAESSGLSSILQTRLIF